MLSYHHNAEGLARVWLGLGLVFTLVVNGEGCGGTILVIQNIILVNNDNIFKSIKLFLESKNTKLVNLCLRKVPGPSSSLKPDPVYTFPFVHMYIIMK